MPVTSAMAMQVPSPAFSQTPVNVHLKTHTTNLHFQSLLPTELTKKRQWIGKVLWRRGMLLVGMRVNYYQIIDHWGKGKFITRERESRCTQLMVTDCKWQGSGHCSAKKLPLPTRTDKEEEASSNLWQDLLLFAEKGERSHHSKRKAIWSVREQRAIRFMSPLMEGKGKLIDSQSLASSTNFSN